MQDNPTEAELDAIHEELVAYLDGELNSTEMQRVERRLADDEAYRSRLSALQKTWDLLDNLPRSTPDESFTRGTVKMVAVNAAEDANRNRAKWTIWRGIIWVAGGLAAAAAAWAGYLFVMARLDKPNEQLVRDLPIIENADFYRHAESVEFLRDLDRAGLFSEEVEDAL